MQIEGTPEGICWLFCITFFEGAPLPFSSSVSFSRFCCQRWCRLPGKAQPSLWVAVCIAPPAPRARRRECQRRRGSPPLTLCFPDAGLPGHPPPPCPSQHCAIGLLTAGCIFYPAPIQYVPYAAPGGCCSPNVAPRRSVFSLFCVSETVPRHVCLRLFQWGQDQGGIQFFLLFNFGILFRLFLCVFSLSDFSSCAGKTTSNRQFLHFDPGFCCYLFFP